MANAGKTVVGGSWPNSPPLEEGCRARRARRGGRSQVTFRCERPLLLLRPIALALRARLVHAYRIIRSSPTLRVTRCRSRYSSKGIANFRLTPVRSLNSPTPILGFLD